MPASCRLSLSLSGPTFVRSTSGGRRLAQGLLVNATSGEPTTLTSEEKARLIDVAVKASAGRRPVAAGIPAESHAEAVTLLALAEKAGADAVVSVTPYYARPPQRGLIAFFVDLAARTELP